MVLEDLLKPLQYVDEQILREYTKLTQAWEKSGKSKYLLSNSFNISSFALFLGSMHLWGGYHYIPPLEGFFHTRNSVIDNRIKPYGSDFPVTSTSVAKPQNIHITIDRITRLPFLITAMSLTATGIYHLMTGIKSQSNQQVHEGIYLINHGISYIGNASSQYVKDTNPTLLKKDPLWKTAYTLLQEKIRAIPQPQPTINYLSE